MSFRNDKPDTFSFLYGRARLYTIPLDPNHHHEVGSYLMQSKSATTEPEHISLFIGSTRRGSSVHWFMGFPAFDKRTGHERGQHVFDMIHLPEPNEHHWIVRERGRDGASVTNSATTHHTQRIVPVVVLDRAMRQHCIQKLFLKFDITIGAGQDWGRIDCIDYVRRTLLRLTEIPNIAGMVFHPVTNKPFSSAGDLRRHVEKRLEELKRSL